jgi:exodeoxyribonuclease III
MAPKTSAPLRLISWNVNGVRAVAKKGFFELVQQMQPDILGLQETKAQDDQVQTTLADLKAAGYHIYSSSAERKGYSGTALITKIKPDRVSFSIGGRADFNNEGRHIMADFTTEAGQFTLFNVYFPNGGSGPERLRYKMDYYAQFQALVEDLVRKGKHVIICGDVNTAHKEIDLARPKENRKISGFLPEECAWVDGFVAAGFVDTFRQVYPEKADAYSWWDMKSGARARNVGWRIDYFFVNAGLKARISDAAIYPDILGSDHCPVVLELK